MTEKRFAPSRLIPFLCASVIPLLIAIDGVKLRAEGGILSPAFFAFHLVIPLCYILLFGLLMFAVKMERSVRVTLAITLSAWFVILFLGFTFFGEHRIIRQYGADELEEPYAAIREEYPLLPDLAEIGDPEDLTYYDYESSLLIFVDESDSLICRYSPEEYEREKAALAERYVFQTETMVICDHTCAPTAELDGYEFRVLSIEGVYEGEVYYPKCLYLIATNDETREIVYLNYYCVDLDYIEDLSEFIRNDCGWKHIR